MGEKPHTYSNKANFTIGTGSYTAAVGVILGTTTIKPLADVRVTCHVVKPAAEGTAQGAVEVSVKTNGNIEVTGIQAYSGTLNSWYATFDYLYR